LRKRDRANLWHSLPAARTPTSATGSCSTAGSEVAGQHAYRRRRSEPRNYRSHHRGLGHYHFGDSDPADDLARPHREAAPGAQARRHECRWVCACRPRLGSPGFRPRGALRRVTRTGVAGLTLGGGMGLTSLSQSISSRPRVSSLRRARIGMLIFLGSAW
jgi:hypothetical protein